MQELVFYSIFSVCVLSSIILSILFFYNRRRILSLELERTSNLKALEHFKAKEEFYAISLNQLEKKNSEALALSNEISRLQTELKFRLTKEEKQLFESKIESLNRELIKAQEKLSSQSKLEADLKALLETTKLEITNQNRAQYSAISNELKKYTDEKGREISKDAKEAFERVVEKDVKETMQKMQESLQIQKETLLAHQKPIEFFTKILSGSRESGSHGEQTIVNQLENMGLKYGIDYLTQVSGRGALDEKLIADVVLLIPNSGKKDVIIIDSKSSTKLGAEIKDFISSVDSSCANFAKKDYRTSVEKRLKEIMPDMLINQTYLFIYLPFDRMLSRISEEKPEFLQKVRERGVGILTPVILDFLLDSIKLYSAKLEFNNNFEKVMQDVKQLIERTSKVLEHIKDVGRSIELSSKKYDTLKSSVVSRFVPIVNKTAKALEVRKVIFDDINEDELKQIEVKS